MTMHLHHPSLSLNGKKKGKQKFRNADEARKSRELDESWKELQKKWGVDAENKKKSKAMSAGTLTTANLSHRNTGQKINSLDTGWIPCVKNADKVYTGTKIKGIGTMHKSNAVPIFSDEQAIEISTMRR